MRKISSSLLVSIVDDDQSIREALASLIQAFGFDVELFSSAEEFLGSSHLHNTDCLILDLRLKGMNGLELQHQLAERHYPARTIFITAHGNIHNEWQARRWGASAFLRKPFSATDLFQALQVALGVSENEK